MTVLHGVRFRVGPQSSCMQQLNWTLQQDRHSEPDGGRIPNPSQELLCSGQASLLAPPKEKAGASNEGAAPSGSAEGDAARKKDVVSPWNQWAGKDAFGHEDSCNPLPNSAIAGCQTEEVRGGSESNILVAQLHPVL